MDSVELLRTLFKERGSAEYLGEAVSQATHMLQAGALALEDSAPPPLVAAALLHDVGHLIAPTSEHVDARHEEAGAAWLARMGFPSEVTEPVRLHVAAKRYLCAVETTYFGGLSAASVASLALQGGPMSLEEAATFAERDHAAAAVAVRRWDEAAKDPGRRTPAFDDFAPVLREVLK
jgi:gamma-butyrobetaine dioxygenase